MKQLSDEQNTSLRTRYYSAQRPLGPGTYPRQGGTEKVTNFDRPVYCKEIDREAWGYVEFERPISEEEVQRWELIPEGVLWFPVTVSSRKHGGGIHVTCGRPKRSRERPDDSSGETSKMQWKTRCFRASEAERVSNVLRGLDITAERVRQSVTQGEVRVSINGKYILSFGDDIVLPERGADPDGYYGADISGWRSSKPDSAFVLGLIWHPLDHAYHYSEMICKKLGLERNEWI